MEIVIALIILIVGIIVAINLSKRKKKVYEGEYCTPKSDEKVEFGSVYFIKNGNCVVQECIEEYTPKNNQCVFDCSPYADIKSTTNVFIQKTCFEECFNSEGSLLEETDVFKYDLNICGFSRVDEDEDEGPLYEKTLLDEVTDIKLVDIKTLKGKIPSSLIGKVNIDITASGGNPRVVTLKPNGANWEHKYQSDLQPGMVYIKYTSPAETVTKLIKIKNLKEAVEGDVKMYGRTLKGKIPIQYKGKVQVRVYNDPNWDWRNVDEEYNNRITPFTPTELEWVYTFDSPNAIINAYVSYTLDGNYFWANSHY